MVDIPWKKSSNAVQKWAHAGTTESKRRPSAIQVVDVDDVVDTDNTDNENENNEGRHTAYIAVMT